MTELGQPWQLTIVIAVEVAALDDGIDVSESRERSCMFVCTII